MCGNTRLISSVQHGILLMTAAERMAHHRNKIWYFQASIYFSVYYRMTVCYSNIGHLY